MAKTYKSGIGVVHMKSNYKMLTIVLALGLSAGNIAIAAGDASAGKDKAAACAACHGADGNSVAPTFPKIAGQNERYLVKQLKDYQGGARQNGMMSGMVAGKSEQDLEDLAAYFSSQTVTPGSAKKELLSLGEKIYRGGNPDSGVAACTACHGPKGEGVVLAGFPALGGQHADYISSQLKAFRAAGRGDFEGDKRINDGESKMMREIASRMTDAEIEAVSSYVSGLH